MGVGGWGGISVYIYMHLSEWVWEGMMGECVCV